MRRITAISIAAVLIVAVALAFGANTQASAPSTADENKSAAMPEEPLMSYHVKHIRAFIVSPGNGWVRVMTAPMWSQELMTIVLPKAETAPVTYIRAEFNLVSLLNQSEPLVYTELAPRFAPHKDAEPRNQAARTLDSFESAALEILLTGKDLVVKPDDGTLIRIMGAVRAQTACLSCHDNVREGALLGAFVYQLRPAPAQPSQPKERNEEGG